MKKIASLLIVALVLCLASVSGLSQRAYAYATEEDDPVYNIYICFPDDDENGYYSRNIDLIVDELDFIYLKSNITIRRPYDRAEQFTAIEEAVDNKADVIVIAPMDDSDYLAQALYDAVTAGIIVIIVGDYNPSYPSGIIYMYTDYYKFGVDQAEAIIEQNENFYYDSMEFLFYYFDNPKGKQYFSGVASVFSQTNLSVTYRSIIDVEEAYYQIYNDILQGTDWYEIASYTSEIAKQVLQAYLDNYYVIGIPSYNDREEYTGIRPFPTGEASTLAADIVNAIRRSLAGESLDDAEEYQGSYLINTGRVPAKVEYVTLI